MTPAARGWPSRRPRRPPKRQWRLARDIVRTIEERLTQIKGTVICETRAVEAAKKGAH